MLLRPVVELQFSSLPLMQHPDHKENDFQNYLEKCVNYFQLRLELLYVCPQISIFDQQLFGNSIFFTH